MFLIQAHWAMLVLAAMAAGVVVVTVCIMRRRTDVALAKIADEFITKYALLDNRRGTERQQILEETAAEIGRVSKQCGAVTDAHAAFINGRYANIVELIRQAIPHIVLPALLTVWEGLVLSGHWSGGAVREVQESILGPWGGGCGGGRCEAGEDCGSSS